VSQEKAVVPRAGLNTAVLSLFKANTASSRKQGTGSVFERRD